MLASSNTAQKMKFLIKDFSSKCDQVRKKLWIWSHLLKKTLMENFIFYAVKVHKNISLGIFFLKLLKMRYTVHGINRKFLACESQTVILRYHDKVLFYYLIFTLIRALST